MTTPIPEMDTLYDFETEAQGAVPPAPPPDPVAATGPKVMTADLVSLDLMRTSKYTIAIQLLPHDGNPAGRLCTIGVQLDKQAPSISAIRGEDFGIMPSPIWQLMEAQAQVAAATKPAATKKKEEIPPPLTAKAKPAPAQKVAPVSPAPAPAPVPPQDDIYSLFDL